MTILITGAQGFLGRQVSSELADAGYSIIGTIARRPHSYKSFFAVPGVEYLHFDIGASPLSRLDEFGMVDTVIDLAWAALDDYDSKKHETQAADHADFLSYLLNRGTRQLIVAGTCQEFGVRDGEIEESFTPNPLTSYAKAKSELHSFLLSSTKSERVSLKWLRFFYLWGLDPKPLTMLGQLRKAIREGEKSFILRNGKKTRDFISLGDAARAVNHLLGFPELSREINLSTGESRSVLDLAQHYLGLTGARIELICDDNPSPSYEADHFWGRPSTLLDSGFEWDELIAETSQNEK